MEAPTNTGYSGAPTYQHAVKTVAVIKFTEIRTVTPICSCLRDRQCGQPRFHSAYSIPVTIPIIPCSMENCPYLSPPFCKVVSLAIALNSPCAKRKPHPAPTVKKGKRIIVSQQWPRHAQAHVTQTFFYVFFWATRCYRWQVKTNSVTYCHSYMYGLYGCICGYACVCLYVIYLHVHVWVWITDLINFGHFKIAPNFCAQYS